MRKLLLITTLFLTSCATMPGSVSSAPFNQHVELPDMGQAPELTNDTWLNVDAPLNLAELNGKVFLLEMWTFG